jgi:hypothetical protein
MVRAMRKILRKAVITAVPILVGYLALILMLRALDVSVDNHYELWKIILLCRTLMVYAAFPVLLASLTWVYLRLEGCGGFTGDHLSVSDNEIIVLTAILLIGILALLPL